jgi:hypothetical protein
MDAIWHHIIVSFKVLAQKGFVGTAISCISLRLTGVKCVFYGWMSDIYIYDRHPHILGSFGTQGMETK